MPAWSAADHSPFDSLERLPSSHVEVLVNSERNETSTKTEHEDDPTSFKRVGITDKRTPSLIPHIGSRTDGKALSPSSCLNISAAAMANKKGVRVISLASNRRPLISAEDVDGSAPPGSKRRWSINP